MLRSSHHTFSTFSFSPRMENGVLGNALEGVHVEEEEGEKTEEESLVENNDNVDGMWRCSICFCVHVTDRLSLSRVICKMPGR